MTSCATQTQAPGQHRKDMRMYANTFLLIQHNAKSSTAHETGNTDCPPPHTHCACCSIGQQAPVSLRTRIMATYKVCPHRVCEVGLVDNEEVRLCNARACKVLDVDACVRLGAN